MTLSDEEVAQKLPSLLALFDNLEVTNGITPDEAAQAPGVIKILVNAMCQLRDVKAFVKKYDSKELNITNLNTFEAASILDRIARTATKNYLERTVVKY